MAFWRNLQHVCNVLVTCSVFCFARLWDLSHVFAAGGGGADHSRGYQVFLSFRGRDVRSGFLSHLYDALKSAGYSVFLDSKEIRIGDDICAAINHAIEVSQIFIIIFSPSFAESPWCLGEAALIARRLQSNRTDNVPAVAIPVFYKLSPSHVRDPDHYESPFAEAFQEHERRGENSQQEIDEWRAALRTISHRRGLLLQGDANGNESKLVKRIVKDVCNLRRTARF